MAKSSHWWESYLIRYAIGAIIGSICVFLLLCLLENKINNKENDIYRNICSVEYIHTFGNRIDQIIQKNEKVLYKEKINIVNKFLFKKDNSFGTVQAIILLLYGITFCYLASAPGLVIHTARRHIFKDEIKIPCLNKVIGKRGIRLISICFIYSFIIILIISSIWHDFFSIPKTILIFCAIFVIIQFVYIFFEYINKTDQGEDRYLLNFYKNLKRARDEKIIDSDSYKHLREHGNAFLLVIFEIIFAALLYFSFVIRNSLYDVVIVIVLWISPAAIVFFIGCKIEHQMIADVVNKKQDESH